MSPLPLPDNAPNQGPVRSIALEALVPAELDEEGIAVGLAWRLLCQAGRRLAAKGCGALITVRRDPPSSATPGG